jgi:hypothetical protein
MTKENLIEPIVNHLSIYIVTKTSYQTPSLYETSTNQGRTQITDNKDTDPSNIALTRY